MGPWFVASALDCGTALVLIVVIALQKAGRLSIERSSMVNLAKMLAVFTCVDLYFFACDLLTSGFPAARAPMWWQCWLPARWPRSSGRRSPAWC